MYIHWLDQIKPVGYNKTISVYLKKEGYGVMKIQKKETPYVFNSRPVCVYELENQNGMKMSVTNAGCSVLTLLVPDKNGNFSRRDAGLPRYVRLRLQQKPLRRGNRPVATA